MKVCDLFAGIGGFSLGLQRAGMTIKYQVEINEFCLSILAKHWPHVKRFKDVREVSAKEIEAIDVVCGGFPCQPFSDAGVRRGKEDDRYLWPEMLRIIQEARPTWVIGENVTGIISMGLNKVLLDLEAINYTVQSFIIPACSLNAPHQRNRVWIVANSYSNHNHGETLIDCREEGVKRKGNKPFCIPFNSHLPSYRQEWEKNWIDVAACLCRMDDGISSRLDRLAALGNAIVPGIAEQIGRAIMQVENCSTKGISNESPVS